VGRYQCFGDSRDHERIQLLFWDSRSEGGTAMVRLALDLGEQNCGKIHREEMEQSDRWLLYTVLHATRDD
jgi:hypothetical protein